MQIKFSIRFLSLNIFFFISSLVALAQKELGSEVSIQSPNASSIGKFGDIPVSLFTGTVNISIPITKINSGPITVPISLNYDGSGCHPDEHPSLVGLNWSLFAGGIIKRQTNGSFDELNTAAGHVSFRGGYYDTCSVLADNNWYSEDFLMSHGGYLDLFPDEFTFNFNGINGVFMLNHEKKWVVRSKENLSLKVTHEILENVLNAPRIISKFILTTNDGTQYTFGGDINAIELSRSALAIMKESYNTHDNWPLVDNLYSDMYVQASAWHLTEIISPDGNRVKFHYSRFKSVQQAMYTEISQTLKAGILGPPYYTYDVNQTNKFLVHGTNIDSITTNDITCSFVRSISNELKPQYKVKPQSQDVCPSEFSNLNYYKLDSIVVKIKNKPVTKYAFNYIERPSERLKLKEVKKISGNNNIEYSYKIEYSAKLLPAYHSGYLDHWGFYNGKNYYGSSSSQTYITVPDLTAYYQSREPDASLMDAEVMKKIIYPTGGYSEFLFEPHTYSSVVRQSPSISIQALPSNKIAGGLRIKMIKTYDAVSATTQTKEYSYVKNYINGGIISSGVLAGEPVYYESSQDDYFKFSSLPQNYLNTTNGNHITYTEVTEITGNGFTSNTYSNHDNGYLDKDALAEVNWSVRSAKFYWKLFGRLDIERGLLLNTKFYTTNRSLQREIINEYNQDANRYNSYVRAIGRVQTSALNTCLVAFPLYTFYPYLEKQTTIDYTIGGEQIRQEDEYSYDNISFQLRSITSLDARGYQKRTQFKYPTDYTYTSNTSVTNEIHDIKALVDKNIVTYPLEKTISIVKTGSEFIVGSRMTHFENLKQERIYDLETTLPIPANEFTGTYTSANGFQYDSKYKEKLHYSKYDDRGNILEVISKDNIPVCYVWGYNKTYPIAKVMNASYSDIVAILGESRVSQLAMSYDDADIRSATQQLRAGLPGSMVYSYTYSPLIGMISETAPNNITAYYEYDHFGRLAVTRNDKQQILKKMDYGYMEIKRISLSTEELDFGQVPVGHSATKTIMVTNTGTLALTITSVILPAGYIVSNSQPISLAPNESINLDITYSASVKGIYSNTIQFVTDAVGNKNVNAKVTVVGTKIIGLSGNLAFGSVTGGPMYPCANRIMTISNTGTELLLITNILTPHPFSANWSSDTILPGQSKSVIISFCPPVPGSFNGTITVVSDKTSGTDIITATGSAN